MRKLCSSRNFIVIVFLIVFATCKKKESISLGSCDNDLYNTEYTGVATWYDAMGAAYGNCMVEFPADKMYGAMNKEQYDNSNACGAYVKITSQSNGKEVIVQILDQCPGCKHGHIDLSPEAFAKLAPLNDGRISIKWEYVKNPYNKNISIRFKDGSNQWWTAVQAIDHKYMIHSIEAKNQNGEFVAMERQSYNYFIDFNGIKDGEPGPYELRITDVAGHSITGTYQHIPEVIIPTNRQFENCN